MKIPIDHAIAVYEKYHDYGVELIYLNDIILKSVDGAEGTISKLSSFSPPQGELLKRSGQTHINVQWNDKLYAYLINTMPEAYRKPYQIMTYHDIDVFINAMRKINTKSGRNRFIVFCEDVYNQISETKIQTVIEYGSEIDYEVWNSVKTKIDKKRTYYIRTSENGIICLVDLRPEGENYIKRFYRNTDLVTLLVGRKSTDTVNVSPDFIGSEDVVSVDEPVNLLETYKDSNARLIILGDTMSDEYSAELLKVREWDRFSRFMMVTNIDFKEKDKFVRLVAKAYNTDNWNLDDFK